MRHPGEVVSKTDILENVWDAAFDGDPNVVEVYVGYLRRKIDPPFGRHAIETVRGVGYRLSRAAAGRDTRAAGPRTGPARRAPASRPCRRGRPRLVRTIGSPSPVPPAPRARPAPTGRTGRRPGTRAASGIPPGPSSSTSTTAQTRSPTISDHTRVKPPAGPGVPGGVVDEVAHAPGRARAGSPRARGQPRSTR